MDRSQWFRVYFRQLEFALLALAFASAPPEGLALLPKVTRRFIMQKACGDPALQQDSHSL